MRGAIPYIINLIVLICLTSISRINYVENLKIVDELPYDDGKGGVPGEAFPAWYVGKPGPNVLKEESSENIEALHLL